MAATAAKWVSTSAGSSNPAVRDERAARPRTVAYTPTSGAAAADAQMPASTAVRAVSHDAPAAPSPMAAERRRPVSQPTAM